MPDKDYTNISSSRQTFSFCYRYKHWDPEILCEFSKVNDYSLPKLMHGNHYLPGMF